MISVKRPAGGLIRPYQRELGLLARVVDLLWVITALWMSLALHGYGWTERYTLLATVSAVLFYLSAELFNVYWDRRSDSLRSEFGTIVAAWGSIAMATLFLGYAFKVTHEYSRLAIGTWFLLVPCLLGAWRGLVRAVLGKLRSLGYNTRNVAILGTGEQGLRVANTVLASQWMGLRLIGAFDDRAPVPGRVPDQLPCRLLGSTGALLETARRGKLDIVYVTLPISDKTRMVALLDALSDTTVSLYIVPDMFLFSMFHGRLVQIGDVPAVGVFETPFYGVDGWIKRAEDIVIASLVLMVMAIPMLLIAIPVRLGSPGPVIFKQRRYGLDGRPFWMWKFRTMTVCENEESGIQQATREDPRVTRFGAFLRRTSLDELPQFINVLKGSMSIVGPRPHATSHNEHYRRLIKGYMVRHKVRPGVTGWAQANGWRGETDTLEKMQARVEHDLWYIHNWSVFLDLKIILLTLLRGWRGVNAY